jgi:hypothetical protein
MKVGIIAAIAALALGIFAVGEAEATWWWGSDVNQRFFGHNITILEDAETGQTTNTQNGIAKGKPGRALVTATLVFGPFLPNPDSEADCPPGFPLEAEVIRFEWGETYDDGSLLAGAADAGQVLCLDVDITQTTAELGGITGSITGGTGRFEGASGTWTIDDVFSPAGPDDSSIITANLTVDLD